MAIWLSVSTVALPAESADDLRQAVKDQNARYDRQLSQLATWCDQHSLTKQAAQTRAWNRPRDPNKYYLGIQPRAVGNPDPPADLPAEVAKWHVQFHKLRHAQADALEALARQAVDASRVSLAVELVFQAIRENPDHPGLRRFLGYQAFQDHWHTPYEIEKIKAGQIWHDRFGWIAEKSVSRYEDGQRWTGSRWLPAVEEAKRHRDIASGWNVETEHYLIHTDHGLETAVELGAKLERLYQVWRQLFLRYYLTEAQVADLFDGRSPSRRPPGPRMEIYYFRDKDEYVRTLKPQYPNIEMSVGMCAPNGTGYFFAGSECDERTLYHEATHQLFYKSRPVAPRVGSRGNYWLVEGVAMYMESLREEEGFYVLGGFDDQRAQAARHRLLVDSFYVPLARLNALTMTTLQADRHVRTLYSQAAGLTLFLIHGDGGRYRDAVISSLAAVYTGRDVPNTLARQTGVALEQLDRQYREFMETFGGAGPTTSPIGEQERSVRPGDKKS